MSSETRLRLSADEVHLFSTSLDAWQSTSLRSLLTPDELDRAGRFRFDRDRERYVVGRGLLRCVLAAYGGTDPKSLRFDYTPYGKPFLDDPRLSFNLAHSEDRALFVVAPGFDIGVDAEVMSSSLVDECVAERFFTPREVADLIAVSADDRARAFLTCWTRKEAYIKGRGEGLSLPLDEFDVTVRDGVAPRLRWTAWSRTEPKAWSLVDVSASDRSYIAAVAARSTPVRIERRDFETIATPAPPRSGSPHGRVRDRLHRS
jgi:4'-phosphopantetheinyl transferase